MKIGLLAAAAFAFAITNPGYSQQTNASENPMSVFADFIGTWKGEVSPPGSEEKLYDVSRWEWLLGGKAVRITHSVGDGEYAGETLISFDPRAGVYVYLYATTGGFFTRGQMNADSEAFDAQEIAVGNPQGILTIRSGGELLTDGTLRVISASRSRAGWSDPDTTIYVRAPDAMVVMPELDLGSDFNQ